MHSILWLIVGCLTICSPVVSVAASSQSLRGSIVGPAHQDYSKQKPVVPASVTSKLPTVEIPFVEAKRLDCPVEPGNDTAERFYADTFAGRVSVRDGSVTYYLRDATVTESLVNASKSSVTGSGKTGARVSSFLGSDKSRWQRSMATYQSVSFGEVYPHIRLDLKAHGNNVEKVFTVREGGKPEAIAINVKGAKGLQLNARGELEILTASGPVTMSSPVAYQEIDGKRISVDCAYQLVSLDSRLRGNDTKQKSVGSGLRTQDS
ncbi:MAG: hypothetical protein GY850_23490, partial [bacterium]|nr:hypothetical protein [bacterium]